MAKTNSLFNNNQIDLLFLIPEKSSNGFPIVCKSFNKSGEEWLTLWCFHNRGSCMQISLRRFLDIDVFGRFLGSVQAEGTKRDFKNLEFANASLEEHKDFIGYLKYLGINNGLISVDCTYYSGIERANEVIQDYERITKIKVRNVYTGNISKYGLGFKLKVRNVIFSNVILHSMNRVRKILIESEWNSDLSKLANAFFAKLLSGDGNIDLDTKDRILPQGRLKITDVNIGYLEDYKKLMLKFGFNPKLSIKNIIARSSFNLNQAKWLLSIGAFRNNPNETRLKIFIEARANKS